MSLHDILQDVKETIKAAWTLPEDERRKIIKRLFKKWHPDRNHDTTIEVFKFIKEIVHKMENGENIDSNNIADIPHFNYSNPPRNSTFWANFQTWEGDTREDTDHRRNEGTIGSFRTGRQQPDHQVSSEAAARQWLRQAKVDYTAAEGCLPRAEIGPHFNWICFMCYQCVEKVLKAMHYKKDCNNVPTSSDLNKLTIGLSTDISQMVRNMMSVVGPRERMMYPDHLNISEIPADIFDRPTAERARDIAKEILEFAEDTL